MLGAQVLVGIKYGKPMFGKDGVVAPMLEKILNVALDGQMASHLTEKSRQNGNRCNDKRDKQVKTAIG